MKIEKENAIMEFTKALTNEEREDLDFAGFYISGTYEKRVDQLAGMYKAYTNGKKRGADKLKQVKNELDSLVEALITTDFNDSESVEALKELIEEYKGE